MADILEQIVAGFSALRTSAAIFATISGGVPFGANSAYQVETSNPFNPASAEVGTSGIAGERAGAATARPRNVPD